MTKGKRKRKNDRVRKEERNGEIGGGVPYKNKTKYNLSV